MKKQTISAELAMAMIAIENALQNERIKQKLVAFNYDHKKVLEGKTLLEEVNLLHSIKIDKYGQQFSSTDAMKAQFEETIALYRQHVKCARLAFENQRATLELLKIRGRRKSDTTGLLEQMHTFYNKIMQFVEEIARYNVSVEEITQAKAMVEALYDARLQQIRSKGEAQDATHKRDVKRKELKVWMSQFKKIARIALNDEPQLLEALGIVVPSQKV